MSIVSAVLVEGQTEEQFVKVVLNPYAESRGVFLQAVVVRTAYTPTHMHKGGGRWKHYARDLHRLLAQTHWHRVGLLIDFYGYPPDAPAADEAGTPRTRHHRRVEAIRAAFSDRRFTPHLALHEFETWVLAAAMEGSSVFPNESVRDTLAGAANAFGGDVELVDDAPRTSPSHRVIQAWPAYLKAVDGIEAINAVPFERLLARCPSLNAWVDELLS